MAFLAFLVMKSCTCDAYPPRPSLVTVHTRSNMSTVSQMQPRSLPSSGGARGLTMDRGAGGTLKLLGTNTQAEPSLEGQCTCRRKWPKTEFFTYYGWSGRCIWVLVAAQWARYGAPILGLGLSAGPLALWFQPTQSSSALPTNESRLVLIRIVSRGDYYFFSGLYVLDWVPMAFHI